MADLGQIVVPKLATKRAVFAVKLPFTSGNDPVSVQLATSSLSSLIITGFTGPPHGSYAKAGDTLLAVNGQSVEGLQVAAAQTLLETATPPLKLKLARDFAVSSHDAQAAQSDGSDGSNLEDTKPTIAPQKSDSNQPSISSRVREEVDRGVVGDIPALFSPPVAPVGTSSCSSGSMILTSIKDHKTVYPAGHSCGVPPVDLDGSAASPKSARESEDITEAQSGSASAIPEESRDPVRVCAVRRRPEGFGFVLKGSRPVHLESVIKGSASEVAGLRPGDRIVAIGSTCSILFGHDQVIQHMRDAGPMLVLTVLSGDIPEPTLTFDPSIIMAPSYDLFGFEPVDMGLDDGQDDLQKAMTFDDEGEADVDSSSEPITPIERPRPLPSPPKSAYQPSASHRRRWLEFLKISNDTKAEPMWNLPDESGGFDPDFDYLSNPRYALTANDTVCAMLVNGVPHNLRRQVWIRGCGASSYKAEVTIRYDEIVLSAAALLHGSEQASQIEKDLLRTFPNNFFFSSFESEGTKRLRRILYSTALTLPDIGYCQGMGMLVAMLLLVMEEEEAFWSLRAMLLRLIPTNYYTSTLLGAMTDQRVLSDLIAENEPRVAKSLQENNIEISLVTLNWFLTAFSTVAPLHTSMRIWDCFMLEGSTFLFKVSLAMITLQASFITSNEEPGDVFNALSYTPGFMNDPDVLMNLSFSFMHVEQQIPSLRKQHSRVLASEMAVIQKRREELRSGTPVNAGKSPSVRRRGLSMLTKSWQEFRKTPSRKSPALARKPKNIAQTERLMRLSGAVLALVSAMQQLLDEESEMAEERQRLREEVVKHIEKKEGETSALMVRRSSSPKTVNRIAGDNRKNPELSGLITDGLCDALYGLLSHDLKSSSFKSVWDFIRQVCNTDDPAPEWDQTPNADIVDSRELLVASSRSIEAAGSDTDHMKFKQLVCKGLNAGVLSDWFSVLSFAAGSTSYKQWYKPTAFLRSRAVMIQVKEDLKRLQVFKFNVHI